MGSEAKASKPDVHAEVDGCKRKRRTISLLSDDNIDTSDDVFIANYKFTIRTIFCIANISTNSIILIIVYRIQILRSVLIVMSDINCARLMRGNYAV